jgi:signal transduction histidine kinase
VIPLFTPLRRRPRFNIVAFTVTVLVTVAALEVADLWWRHQRALKQGAARAQNVSVLLAEYVRGSFASADAALRQIVVHSARIGGPSAADEVWDPILAAAHAALPEVGSFTITDRDGIITHSTVRAIQHSSRRDFYVFKELAASDRNDLVVDRPFRSATSSQFLIPLGRRLGDERGRFSGAVVATIVPESYRAFFRTLDLGRGGVVSVLHPDGVVLFREPSEQNPMNATARDDAILQRARQQPNGAFEGPITPGGPLFVTAYRTVSNPVLVVGVSLPKEELLEDWYTQRRVAAAAYGALALTLSVVVFFLFRVVSARERVERELAEVQRKEAETLRLANERLAEALDREQQARRAVEDASRLKDEFLMTVSHELRTPLTAIYGWVRVLASREMPREDQAKALGAIERNALAQTRLIDDLLDVSRAITGKMRLDLRRVDAGAVVRGTVETLSPALSSKGLHLTLNVDPDQPPITADPDRLQQIVWNLLSNAIKFTPQDGRVDVTVGRGADGWLEIVVSDSGVGMAADLVPHVFDRFRQGEVGTSRRFGGLGLGLAIVRQLVEQHGGTVEARSDGPGKGATFRVRLPDGQRDGSKPPIQLSDSDIAR